MSKKSDIGFFDYVKVVFEVLTDTSPNNKSKSSYNDGYERCSDCSGTGHYEGHSDDDGGHSCPYCGGVGKWKKSA